MGVKGLKTQSECKAVIFICWLSYSDYSIHLKIKKSEKKNWRTVQHLGNAKFDYSLISQKVSN